MMQKIGSAVAFILLLLAGGGSYFALKSHMASEIYRDRLEELGRDYENLAREYQDAVRKSAVTELRVQEGSLSVLVRAADGVLEEIETPYDPSREIYIDYVLLNGRLWIRRIFDHDTPPSQGLVIDPRRVDVNWHAQKDEAHGKAVYRQLSTGRWAVTVTGSGALGLTKVSDDTSITLISPPEIRDFSELEEAIRQDLADIGPVEIVQRWLSR